MNPLALDETSSNNNNNNNSRENKITQKVTYQSPSPGKQTGKNKVKQQ